MRKFFTVAALLFASSAQAQSFQQQFSRDPVEALRRQAEQRAYEQRQFQAQQQLLNQQNTYSQMQQQQPLVLPRAPVFSYVAPQVRQLGVCYAASGAAYTCYR